MYIQDADSINIFFSLLRSGMYGEPVPVDELPASIDWDAIGRLSRKHAVLGIIIDSVQLLPEGLRPPAALYAKMSGYALKLIRTNLIIDKTVAKLVEFLGSHGIHGTLLKGAGVARYYRAPQMRMTGDIDFYVGREQYEKACGLCREHLMEGRPLEETEKHFSFRFDGITIELHRIATRIYSPFRKRRFQDWLVYELEESPARRVLKVGPTDIILPSYDFDAIFIFYHAWRHLITGGIGLRQLCDWAMIFHSHRKDIDGGKLEESIRRFGLTEGWRLFACIAVRYLGVPADKIPLFDPRYYGRSEKILEEILAGGNFGYYSKAYLRSQAYGKGLRQGLIKVRNITGYFLSLFPLIPVEATFLYFNRLYKGVMNHQNPKTN